MTNQSGNNPQPPRQSGHDTVSAPEHKPIAPGKALLGVVLVLVVSILLGVWGVLSRRSA